MGANCKIKQSSDVEKWLILGKQAEQLLPGYEAVSMDPGITLVLYGRNRFNEDIEIDRVTLTQKSIELLIKGKS